MRKFPPRSCSIYQCPSTCADRDSGIQIQRVLRLVVSGANAFTALAVVIDDEKVLAAITAKPFQCRRVIAKAIQPNDRCTLASRACVRRQNVWHDAARNNSHAQLVIGTDVFLSRLARGMKKHRALMEDFDELYGKNRVRRGHRAIRGCMRNVHADGTELS